MELDYRISVLIPCHSTQFLPESIASIREQTLDKNKFEVVIITDRVDQAIVVRILEGSDLNYRIISSHTPGIVAALNTGLTSISAEYVARMDEDDVMYPNRLEAQLNYLEAVPNCVAVGGQLDLINQNGALIGQAKFHSKVGGSYKKLLTTSPVAHPAGMIRRCALSEIGGYRSFLAEDWDLWLRLREIGEVHNLLQKVIKYRIHDTQLSRQKMYLQSRARIVVGVSHFARLTGFADAPASAAGLEEWLEETTKRLSKGSLKFRLFIRWATRFDAYHVAFNDLIATRQFRNGLSLLTKYPGFFLRDLLKKCFG